VLLEFLKPENVRQLSKVREKCGKRSRVR